MNQPGRMEKVREILDVRRPTWTQHAAALAEVEETETRLAYFTDGEQTITVGRQWLKDLEYRAEAAEAERDELYEKWVACRVGLEKELSRAALVPADRNTT